MVIATVASRSSTQAMGLEVSFLAIAMIAVAALPFTSGIPNRPVYRAGADDPPAGDVTTSGEGRREAPLTACPTAAAAITTDAPPGRPVRVGGE